MKALLTLVILSGVSFGQHPVGYMNKQDTSFTVEWKGKTYQYTGYQNSMNAMGWWTNHVDPWMIYDTMFNVKAPESKAAVQKWGGTALVSGDLKANTPTLLGYDGTHWQMLSLNDTTFNVKAPESKRETPKQQMEHTYHEKIYTMR